MDLKFVASLAKTVHTLLKAQVHKACQAGGALLTAKRFQVSSEELLCRALQSKNLEAWGAHPGSLRS